MLMIDGGCAKKSIGGANCMESSGNNTGGVIAFPSDWADPNLTTWDRVGPTTWHPCNASAWPSPIWLNPVSHKYNLLAVHGAGEARFEATDESFLSWKLVDPAFVTGIRGLGGGMWHELPPNVDGVAGGRWATHVMQGALGSAFNGLPTFIMGVYDARTDSFRNVSKPMLLDAGGGVDYGQLSWTDTIADRRTLFVSWLRLTEATPPDCGTQGQLTAVRDVRYDPRIDRLVHQPIAEYFALRAPSPLFEQSHLVLEAGAPPATLYAAAAGSDGGISMDAELNVSIPTSLGAATVTLAVRCADVAHCAGGASITLALGPAQPDGTRHVDMHVDYAYHISVGFTLLGGESSLPLRVLSDTRSLEIFAGFGRAATSVTMLSTAGSVTASANTADVEVSAAAWTMAL